MPTSTTQHQVGSDLRPRSALILASILACGLLVPHVAWSQRVPPAGAPTTGKALPRNEPAQTPAAPATPTTPKPPTVDQLFDGAELNVIELSMKDSDWQTLTEHYKENTYYLADFKWKGQQTNTVGVRSRGGGSRSQAKPSLRIDFNRYMADQRLLGLKSLVLVNGLQDASMMRQRLAFTVFAKLGIPASRASHAKVYVNGNYIGLYQVIESVDKVMLPRAFDDPSASNKEDDGYLYEYEWHDYYYWGYLGSDLEEYARRFVPQTHESESPADLYGRIEDMIRGVNLASDRDFEMVAREYFDVDRLAAFLGVESFLAEGDGFLGDWGVNNIYLYQFEKQSRWAIIPWDKDLAFYDVDYSIFRHVGENVLASRLLALPSARKVFLDTLLLCATRAMEPDPKTPNIGWLEAEARRVLAQVKDAAYADRQKAYQDSEFDKAVSELVAFAARRASIVTSAVAEARTSAGTWRR